MLPRNTMQYEFENEYEYEGEGEFENEFENEYEFEGEGEFENEYEFEGEGEFENEYEFEGEGEFENEYEYENEAFIGRIAKLARRLAPRLKKVAPIAARVVGDAIAGPQFQYEMEGEFENEYEYENESEYEYEYETLPQLGSLAKAFATMASKVQSQAEAEAYAGAIAAQTLPFKSASIGKVSPQLIKGSAALTKTLRKSPSTRPLVKTLPIVLAKVGKILKQKNAQGKQITPALAARVMAKVTAKVLGNPMTAAKALMGSSRTNSQAALPERRRQRKPVYR